MNPGAVYSMDTSALLDGLERYYPEAVFPGLWERVDDLVAQDRLLLSEEVWEECRVHDAATKSWCDARGKNALVVATDAAIAAEVSRILQRFPRLVANMKGRNRADPFVIALARLRKATVVTGEGADGTENRPKIPFICHELNIPCLRFTEIIKAEGWQFR